MDIAETVFAQKRPSALRFSAPHAKIYRLLEQESIMRRTVVSFGIAVLAASFATLHSYKRIAFSWHIRL
jgi:hypothetical protein